MFRPELYSATHSAAFNQHNLTVRPKGANTHCAERKATRKSCPPLGLNVSMLLYVHRDRRYYYSIRDWGPWEPRTYTSTLSSHSS